MREKQDTCPYIPQQEQTAVVLRFPRRRRRKSAVRRNKKLARILFMPKPKEAL
jgi:hypothetical protein